MRSECGDAKCGECGVFRYGVSGMGSACVVLSVM